MPGLCCARHEAGSADSLGSPEAYPGLTAYAYNSRIRFAANQAAGIASKNPMAAAATMGCQPAIPIAKTTTTHAPAIDTPAIVNIKKNKRMALPIPERTRP